MLVSKTFKSMESFNATLNIYLLKAFLLKVSEVKIVYLMSSNNAL